MQALTRNIRQFCELLESQGRIDEIPENHPCSLCFSAEEQRRRFIKKLLLKRRVTFDSSDNCLFEISGRGGVGGEGGDSGAGARPAGCPAAQRVGFRAGGDQALPTSGPIGQVHCPKEAV